MIRLTKDLLRFKIEEFFVISNEFKLNCFHFLISEDCSSVQFKLQSNYNFEKRISFNMLINLSTFLSTTNILIGKFLVHKVKINDEISYEYEQEIVCMGINYLKILND